MAKATFDIQGIRSEATRGLHAGVGAADLALEAVRDYVAEAQKKAQRRFEDVQKDAQKAIASAQRSVRGFEFEPQAIRTQATHVVSARVEELSKDARARRSAIEKRVAELQSDTQRFWVDNVETATGTYVTLAQRGEKVVKRIRKETASNLDPGPVSKTTGETATVRKAPVRKPAAAKKSSAKKTTAKKATAKKATARKTTATKATPAKAPAAG